MRVPGRVGLVLLGAGYGVVLGLLAFVTAGLGHGTYVLVGFSSAPVGVLGIPAALFGTPLIWAGMGFLLSRVSVTGPRRGFLAAAVVHYLGGVLLLLTRTYGDWAYMPRVLADIPWVVLSWVLVYIGGQALMWWAYAVQVRGIRSG